jgi:hypothetical protein
MRARTPAAQFEGDRTMAAFAGDGPAYPTHVQSCRVYMHALRH